MRGQLQLKVTIVHYKRDFNVDHTKLSISI